jgi:hypothetical protein
MGEIIKKKRGRKPKYSILLNDNIENNDKIVNTEEENIILHLPITINEINQHNNNNDIFLFCNKEDKIIDKDSENEELIKSSSTTNKIICNNINKIITHLLNINKHTKCWWCKNSFDNPAVQLPEDYYNNTFYCIGNFCSYNCVKSYNLDLNDISIWKRESLINLLYYNTYSKYINIIPSPHWITLKEYGGILSIVDFRNNFIYNNKEYLLLHPPIISRQMQIEESYKLNKLREVPIDKVNKLYSDIESDYMIKRNKPLHNNHLNLEITMGLKKVTK